MNIRKETHGDMLEMAWQSLIQTDKNTGEPKLITVATISQNGPEQRTFGLGSVDPKLQIIELGTDSETPKVAEIQEDPRVSVLRWDPMSAVQARFKGIAEIIPASELKTAWEELPEHLQRNFGVTPAPGTKISAGDDYKRQANFDRYAVIRIRVTEIDVVELGKPYHLRAYFDGPNLGNATWLSP